MKRLPYNSFKILVTAYRQLFYIACQAQYFIIMATIYKIRIKTVSAFCAYDEKYIKEMFEKFLKEYKDKETKLGFESTEIEVERS